MYAAQLAGGLAVLLVYLGLVLFVATQYVRRANQRWLTAHQEALRGRLDVDRQLGSSQADIAAVLACLEGLHGRPAESRPSRLDSVRGWTGAAEIAAWVRLHEAQRLEVWALAPAEVRARFARAMGQVSELSAVRQSAWLRRWDELEDADHNGGTDDQDRAWRAELSQLLAEIFNARDSTYNQLVSLYGKATWLVLAAFLAVSALLAAGYGLVLLAGFAGGLISRMQRLVYGRGRPTAYGTSWVPLFLAPLLGGMAAWAGLELLAFLREVDVVSMRTVLGADPTFRLLVPSPVLGLAVLLGFSERFLNQLGTQAEHVIAAGPGPDPEAAVPGSLAAHPGGVRAAARPTRGG